MQIVIDIHEKDYQSMKNGHIPYSVLSTIMNGTPLADVLDKIRAEIENCLKALDEIEKSGLNIYLPNEISGRRLTYQQCLEFIDKYKSESEEKE